MRILVVNHEFPPIGGGGGRAAEHICQTLAKRGYAIEVLTSHLEGLTRAEERDGYHITRIPCKRTQPFKASFLSMGLYVLAGFWAGRRYIRASRPDLIHVHFAVPAGALAWALSKLYRTPYVLTAHLGDVPGGTREKTGGWFRFVFPFTRPIWRGASEIVAVSEFTRGLALKHYNEEIQVIPLRLFGRLPIAHHARKLHNLSDPTPIGLLFDLHQEFHAPDSFLLRTIIRNFRSASDSPRRAQEAV